MNLAFAREYLDRNGVLGLIHVKEDEAFAPVLTDLARLHWAARRSRSRTILEFGVGYSNIVFARALQQNAEDLAEDPSRYRCHAVDASQHWIEVSAARVPAHLAHFVEYSQSEVRIGVVGDGVCSLYDQVPDVTPDLIYLDAPWPGDVDGSIGGISFKGAGRTIVAGDLVRMEPLLIPGTVLIVDGRTNNARFLRSRFRRGWDYFYEPEDGCHLFLLKEPPLGARNDKDMTLRAGPDWQALSAATFAEPTAQFA